MKRTWLKLICLASLAGVSVDAQTPRESPLNSTRASQFADSILRLMTYSATSNE